MITMVCPFISANDDYSSKKSPFVSFLYMPHRAYTYNPQSAIMQYISTYMWRVIPLNIQKNVHICADKVNWMWHLVFVQRLYYAYELWKFNSFWIEGLKGWSIRHKWNLLTTKFLTFLLDLRRWSFVFCVEKKERTSAKQLPQNGKDDLLCFNNLGKWINIFNSFIAVDTLNWCSS